MDDNNDDGVTMSVLLPSMLETADYGAPGWVHIYNANVDRLDALLLRLQALADVDPTGLGAGVMPVWLAGKWRLCRF